MLAVVGAHSVAVWYAVTECEILGNADLYLSMLHVTFDGESNSLEYACLAHVTSLNRPAFNALHSAARCCSLLAPKIVEVCLRTTADPSTGRHAAGWRNSALDLSRSRGS